MFAVSESEDGGDVVPSESMTGLFFSIWRHSQPGGIAETVPIVLGNWVLVDRTTVPRGWKVHILNSVNVTYLGIFLFYGIPWIECDIHPYV